MFHKLSTIFARRSNQLILLSLIFIGGVIAAYWWPVVQAWWAVYLLPLLIAARKRPALIFFGACMVAGIIGNWRGSIYVAKLNVYKQWAGKSIILTGTASNDSVYGAQSQLSFDMTRAQLVRGPPLVGSIQVSGFGLNMVYRGDVVQVRGKLILAHGNAIARVSYAQLRLVSHHPSLIDSVRRRFEAGLQSALPEPLASFGMGLLIGQRNTLPADISNQLQIVGLTHIIAVSGYNLTIIMDIVRRLCAKRSKYQYILLNLALMLLFLALSGMSPSITRASVIAGLNLVAWYYGREFPSVTLITLAAALTIFSNPLYAWNNVSWTLSFLAFFGVVVIAPIVTKRAFNSRQPPLIVRMIIETLSAELITQPYILVIFGQISLVSLLSNLLVASLIPLAMILTVIAGLAGMCLPAIAGWLAWPATLLMTSMLDVVNLLSHIPHAFVQNMSFPWWWALVVYGLVGICCLVAWYKTIQNAILTDRIKDSVADEYD